jgi:hypothetical protein
MNKERHTEYAKKIMELQKSNGEALSKLAMEHLIKLAKISRGDIAKFEKLVKVSSKLFLKNIVLQTKENFTEAVKVGKEYGKRV